MGGKRNRLDPGTEFASVIPRALPGSGSAGSACLYWTACSRRSADRAGEPLAPFSVRGFRRIICRRANAIAKHAIMLPSLRLADVQRAGQTDLRLPSAGTISETGPRRHGRAGLDNSHIASPGIAPPEANGPAPLSRSSCAKITCCRKDMGSEHEPKLVD